VASPGRSLDGPRGQGAEREGASEAEREMSLVREILDDATDSKVDIGTVLRKCKILAARLKNVEFANWVHNELNGYPDRSQLPAYRIASASAKAHLVDKWGRIQLPNAPIMASKIPEQIRCWAEKAYLDGAISSYAALLPVGEQNGEIIVEWPQEIAVAFGASASGYSRAGFQCISARLIIQYGQIIALIDTVRNRVVDFLLQIDEVAPDAGEQASETLSPERVGQIFNNYIFGGMNNLSSASSHVTQSQTGNILAGDWETLASTLESLGVQNGDIAELKRDLDETVEPHKTVTGWLGKLAMAGVTTLATDGVQHAAEAIAAYMGWKG
jgi:hypothetical protein